MARRRTPPPSDPFAILGVPRGANADQIRQARNELAKRHHPDVGGSAQDMQRVNEAADLALRLVGAIAPPSEPTPTPGEGARGGTGGPIGRDHPSFTIEALPADAFEALLIVANVLGQVADDDPPYRLEVVLTDPARAWCRLDVVPDGGGSTVSLSVASSDGVTVDQVRDRFVVELNRLDWDRDGPHPPLPS
jgi:hypothetical protein